MSETPATQPETTTDDAEAVGQTGDVHCRHCGQPTEQTVQAVVAGQDWLCPACERWQQTVICPTCKSAVHVDSLPPEAVPEPHAPARRRRAS